MTSSMPSFSPARTTPRTVRCSISVVRRCRCSIWPRRSAPSALGSGTRRSPSQRSDARSTSAITWPAGTRSAAFWVGRLGSPLVTAFGRRSSTIGGSVTTTSRSGNVARAPLLASDPARSYQFLQDEIDTAVERVLGSGWFILGKEVAALEAEFAEYLGCRHAIGVASGTDALRVALIASGIGQGDEVVTVANAGDPTPMAIWSVGAVPRLVDVDPLIYTMSVTAAEKVIGPRTRARLP